ncbi:HEAT repeat domain-containing protein [Methylobacterium sp. J-088]|nr:HEAT repeat domain-containing protein [Methylobacterium sp. J-088]
MFLTLIWEISVGLAALSVATMALLIIARNRSVRLQRDEGQRRDTLLVTMLEWLETADPGQGRTIIEALSQDQTLAMNLLIEVFETVRGEGQQRLAALAETAGIGVRLRRDLASGDVRNRLAASEGLAWFPSEATVQALVKAINDPNDDVSFTAATALLALGSDLAFDEALIDRLARLNSSRRVERVLAQFAQHRPEALLALVKDEARSIRIRTAGLDALTQTGIDGILDLILSLQNSAFTDLRVAVARNLGSLGHPEGYSTIARYLSDERWEVRCKAAEAVGRLNLLNLGPQLCDLLLDENWWVRHRAGEALAKLGEHGIAALQEIVALAGPTALGDTARHVLAEVDAVKRSA